MFGTVSIVAAGSLLARLERRTGTVAILHDVTSQHEMAMLQRELIARVSHELRTPLTSIIGFVHLFRTDRQRLPESDVDRYLDVIRRQGERLERLVADLLWSSRIELGRVKVQGSDAGSGVPHRFGGELFGRFSQVSTGDRRTSTGLGLGLVICRSLVEANHRSIGYGRREGRTCFEVRLPTRGPEVPSPRTSRP